MLDPFGPLFGSEGTASRRSERPAADPPPPAGQPNLKYRIDAAHPQETQRSARHAPADSPPPPQAAQPKLPIGHKLHAAHRLSPPHFTSQAFPPNTRTVNWLSFAGQLVAYLGVGALTVGTVLILVGYFGGPASYAPTGWLITTIGQMFLFLGVVTLVSGGMEQTTHEVARRVDRLGEKISRLEERTLASFPRGPSFPVAGTNAEGTSREQQLREQIAQLQQQLEQFR
jgi:hypothetical protein